MPHLPRIWQRKQSSFYMVGICVHLGPARELKDQELHVTVMWSNSTPQKVLLSQASKGQEQVIT